MTSYPANTLMARIYARKLAREAVAAGDGSLAVVGAELCAYFDKLNDLYFPRVDRIDNAIRYFNAT
jgi:hypothetical protein